ncbi:MAG: hypothetical protein J6D20_04875 [Clostridia bacterium]|nr:hypothetical protein [Clostridia bacterium]
MISEERSNFKSWSNLKKQMEDLLCDNLKNRITYFYTRYHKARGSFGRATINLDKNELIAFSWDMGIYVQWNDEYKMCTQNPDVEQAAIHNTLMNEKWMPQGTLCHHDFLEAATTYLKIDISVALNSDNYILRVFAYMDRRIGKRTLIKIKDDVETLPEWVKQFYRIRCEAEELYDPRLKCGVSHTL